VGYVNEWYGTFVWAGPATYGPVNNRSNGFTIKSRVPYNDPLCNTKPGPAPGAYDPLERSKISRGFSMGIRHSPHVMPVIGAYDLIY